MSFLRDKNLRIAQPFDVIFKSSAEDLDLKESHHHLPDAQFLYTNVTQCEIYHARYTLLRLGSFLLSGSKPRALRIRDLETGHDACVYQQSLLASPAGHFVLPSFPPTLFCRSERLRCPLVTLFFAIGCLTTSRR